VVGEGEGAGEIEKGTTQADNYCYLIIGQGIATHNQSSPDGLMSDRLLFCYSSIDLLSFTICCPDSYIVHTCGKYK
jgi:hypothetical protein